MRVTSFGQALFAAAMLGLGMLSLVYRDFALQWQPLPASVPGRSVLAVISGLFLIAAGVGLLTERRARISALALSAYLLFWVLFKLRVLFASPTDISRWLGTCEDLSLALGAWVLYMPLAHRFDYWAPRILFGLSFLVFGASHFAYPDFTAGMIPEWMPARLWLAYLTGAGHCAAGLGILTLVLPRLAATAEAAMMSSFVLLVHLPSLWTDPAPFWGPDLRTRITLLLVAMALSASAWCLAFSLRDRKWGFRLKAVPAS